MSPESARDPRSESSESAPSAGRKTWTPPQVRELPRLTDLTLQTGSPIPGFGDVGGGTSVF